MRFDAPADGRAQMGVVCTVSAVVRFATGVVFVVVFSVNAVLAGDFEDAREAYNRHDYALALRLFRPLRTKAMPTPRHSLD